jgi:hypothetical protein
MARRAPAAFALALVLVACAPAAPPATPLNSERIEQVFGSYGIDVLYSEPQLRLSSLYSTHAGTEITRTLAIVGYPDVVDPRLAEPDALIQDGASIGASLQAAGWTVAKHNLFFGEVAAPAVVSTRMAVAVGTVLATHGYVLAVTRGDSSIDYATIAELHHPDYLDLEMLIAIYGELLPADAAAARRFRRFIDIGLAGLAPAGSAERE